MTQKPHICHVITGMQVGGAERLLVDLAGPLSERFRLTVCFFVPGPLEAELMRQGVATIHLRSKGRLDPRPLWQLVSLFRRDPPVLVHTHLIQADLFGRLAARLAGVPAVVSTVHNLEAWRNQAAAASADRLTLPLADRLVAVSGVVFDDLVARRVVTPSRLRCIPNGIDVRPFAAPDLEPLPELRALKDRGHYLIGAVGRFHPQKGHRYLVEAAVQVVRRIPGARFILAGDGPLRADLEEQMSRLGVRSAFHFLGRRMDVPQVLAGLDLFVLPSLYEGLPLACLEAMAAGVPVVATAVGGVPEVIRHGETGWLVRPGAPAELAESICSLAANRAGAEAIAGRGQHEVLTNYTVDVTARRTRDLYREVLSGVVDIKGCEA